MIRFLGFAIVLAAVHYWLHRRLVRATELQGRPKLLADGALIVLWLLAVVGVGSGEVFSTAWARPPGFVGWVWLAAVFYLVLGSAVVGLIVLGARLARVQAVSPTDPRRRTILRAAGAGVVVSALAAMGYGVWEAATPRVVRARIPLARLPEEFSGLRIALISDLHVGPARGRGFTEKVVRLVNSEHPDLIAIAGDLVDGTVAKVGRDLEPLADLVAPLGVYGVAGNHEFYADDGGAWMNFWETLGVEPLRNSRAEVVRNGAVIDIAGVYDITAPAPYEPDMDAALAGRDDNRFVILLAHQPLHVEEASEHNVDLQLSGHTHGGQMWPLRTVVALVQPTVSGLDRIGNTVIYTTIGAGAWGPPVRVGAPPEIAILTLVRAVD
ncbi:metallophosphoesterase [Antrihabitans sp. YC2-6]|uniref:metallophosphoesterase n=1 Tax=Antrihabitans sp. YC2-6 TaxID=2799498 RepID=UPI0018F6A77C|nr:metallophosphoesterase [Antrihabitans sp. YC2-6]MBJ8345873.1 metallophosphoesterase [Antrihabitans sp. YC2-6]